MNKQHNPKLLFYSNDIDDLRKKRFTLPFKKLWGNYRAALISRMDYKLPNPPLIPSPGHEELRSTRPFFDDFMKKYSVHYHAVSTCCNLTEIFSFAYVLTRDIVYLAKAKEFLMTPLGWGEDTWNVFEKSSYIGFLNCFKLRGMALGYDWIAEELSSKERNAVSEKIKEETLRIYQRAKNGENVICWGRSNHAWLEFGILGLIGLLFYHEKIFSELVEFCIERFRKELRKFIGKEGDWPESNAYIWEYAWTNAFLFFHSLKRKTGIDILTEFPAFKKLPNFVNGVYNPCHGMMFDEDAIGFDGAIGNAYSLRPAMMYLAKEFHDPKAQWFACQGIAGKDDGKILPGPPYTPVLRLYLGHLEYLWFDNKILPQEPTSKSCYFKNTGIAMLRSGRSHDSTFIGFKSGKHVSWHDRLDQNKFVLFSHGERIIEQLYSRLYLDWDYFKTTLSANTLLVNKQIQLEKIDGKIKFFYSNDSYDYVIGEASQCYKGLRKFERHLIFIKPDIVVVADFCSAKTPSRYDWQVHTKGDFKVIDNGFEIAKRKVKWCGKIISPKKNYSVEINNSPPTFEGPSHKGLSIHNTKNVKDIVFVVVFYPAYSMVNSVRKKTKRLMEEILNRCPLSEEKKKEVEKILLEKR